MAALDFKNTILQTSQCSTAVQSGLGMSSKSTATLKAFTSDDRRRSSFSYAYQLQRFLGISTLPARITGSGLELQVFRVGRVYIDSFFWVMGLSSIIDVRVLLLYNFTRFRVWLSFPKVVMIQLSIYRYRVLCSNIYVSLLPPFNFLFEFLISLA